MMKKCKIERMLEFSRDPRFPNLFIVGAPKCGTSSLAYYLSQHASVTVSEPKEPQFFNNDFPKNLYTQPEKYLSCFDLKPESIWKCDATTDYLFSQTAIANISRVSNAKFIVMFREHAELAFSLHQEEVSSANENLKCFEEAWNMCESRRQGKNIPKYCQESIRLDYRSRISIGEQLNRMLECTTRDQILFIDFEVLKNDVERMWADVCSFLGIENDQSVDFSIKNERREVKGQNLIYISRNLIRLKARLGFRKNFGIAKWLVGLQQKKAKTRMSIDPDLKKKICEEFRYDRILVSEFAKSGPASIMSNF